MINIKQSVLQSVSTLRLIATTACYRVLSQIQSGYRLHPQPLIQIPSTLAPKTRSDGHKVKASFKTIVQKPMSKVTVDLHRHKHCYKKSGCCIAGSQILKENKLNLLSLNILLICQNQHFCNLPVMLTQHNFLLKKTYFSRRNISLLFCCCKCVEC